MSGAQYVLAVMTFAAWGLLLWKGRGPERLAAITLIVLAFASPVLSNHSQVAAMLLSAAGCACFVALALWRARWWLIVAAGVQLVVAASHLAWLVFEVERLWSTVSIRLLLWFFIIVAALFGTAEARWAPYAQSRSSRQPPVGH